MKCFRIDESGYTGFDLLNFDQPFQGATALAIEDDDAARLIKEHFPRLQDGERYPKAGRWILAGNPTDMCQIWINEEGVGLTDGRHRFAWLRDRGVSAIPVQLSPDSLERGIELFASEVRTSILTRPTESGDTQ